ncbi:sortilin, putative [Plasmodium knowlesi strain H]|uniref:Sortilin, putative n=3 Tax=Plasmodium knowlesi TaxID=5850 RepID=A0A5K1VPI8_PLAKH|nr:sortilin, putative [Plasmodium knowlesi strain H]OTN65268.1 putative Sortilin [Plasmodium knowlesi]CAA9989631.1 sortilin, putative [Plasmodium knowlesi strain H]SBO22723.1 sortilin, putative [Plasmodium knowlesi strain H]SBO23190.1 sortilin, putative [Plasmodium knowlesi strain H]VVS79105.1 sortilin, putative [Plasmodium knowlesi strain H]|eukprot:XP_002260355.1 sortilin, putative [Plasmodium knowlesi strain H]
MKKKVERKVPRFKCHNQSDERKTQTASYKHADGNKERNKSKHIRRALLFFNFLFLFFSLTDFAQCQVAKKKVSVSEINFDSAVEDVQWCGNNHMTVLVKTVKGRLYRSADGGKIWTNITSSLSENPVNKNEPANHTNEVTTVDLIMVNPINKNIVLIIGNNKNHFVSEDSGESFRIVNYKNKINFWQFHSTKTHWALVSSWTSACYSTDEKSGECMQTLSVTKDLGRTFQLMDIYVVQFNWGDKDTHSEDTVYYTRHKNRNGHQQRFSGWSKDVDFVKTDNFGKNVDVLVKQGNKFLISNGYIFVARLNDVIKQTVNMMVSTDGGKTFNKANLPENIHEKSYTVLDTSEGAIMLHVNHGTSSDRINTGNVYISDASGLNYTLSLPNNIRTSSGECEFDRILSLDGVYIANFLDENDDIKDEDLRFRNFNAQLEEDISPFQTNTEKRKKQAAKGKNEDLVRTVISFNKGGHWSYLKAPKVDSRGNKYDCGDNCFLHLHGITNYHQYAPFYSIENAVGIIMGTGNVGSHLRYESDEVNTFLSRDGGVTWMEAHKGPYIYEYGDHGGLIVMADDLRKTNQIVFSWNEGQSWFDFELGQFSIEVDNIVAEPNSSSVEFLVYGTRNDVGVLYHLDFNALGQPLCKGLWAADSVSSDYETWSPTSGSFSDKCILGRKITYTRRKQTSECFNGKDLKRTVDKKACECTPEDYECETGFTRKVGSYECKPNDPTLTIEGCTSSSYFYANAYRKVPGDICVNGWVPEKVPVPCPAHAPFNRSAKSILFILFILGLIMLIVTYLCRNPKFKHLFYNYGFDTFEHVKYSVIKTKRGNVNTNVFEPEMEFIDAEQDDNEEDVPTLLSYSNDRNRTRNSDFKLTRNRSNQNNYLTSRNVSPPQKYPENIELL